MDPKSDGDSTAAGFTDENDAIIIGNSIDAEDERFGACSSPDADTESGSAAIFIRIILYDTVCTTILPIELSTPTKEICNSLRHKIDVSIMVSDFRVFFSSRHYEYLLVE